jgi:peptidoglycan/LPS O-acetylase OafA/YrhL
VLAVETFFVLGGFLQTISILKLIEKNRLNIPRVLWRRYLRYTPAGLGASFLYVLHPHLLGENVFNYFERVVENPFWPYLLQIQNYYLAFRIHW